jgi:hypothetical protein
MSVWASPAIFFGLVWVLHRHHHVSSRLPNIHEGRSVVLQNRSPHFLHRCRLSFIHLEETLRLPLSVLEDPHQIPLLSRFWEKTRPPLSKLVAAYPQSLPAYLQSLLLYLRNPLTCLRSFLHMKTMLPRMTRSIFLVLSRRIFLNGIPHQVTLFPHPVFWCPYRRTAALVQFVDTS